MASSSSFDSSAYGISAPDWSSFSPQTQAVVSTLANYSNVLAQRNQIMPMDLSKKTLKKLWDKAQNDPTIKKYYAQDLQIGTKTLQDNMHIQKQLYQTANEQSTQQYVDSKKQLDQAKAAAGQVYSGYRSQAHKELDKQQTDVLASSRAQMQNTVNSLESQFEQTYGSKALAALGLGDTTVSTGADYADFVNRMNVFNKEARLPLIPVPSQTQASSTGGISETSPGFTPIGSQSNWQLPSVDAVSYTPIGGLAGTEAQQQLADIEAQFQSNIADKQSKSKINSLIQKYKSLQGMA